jgi:hypothetical protein
MNDNDYHCLINILIENDYHCQVNRYNYLNNEKNYWKPNVNLLEAEDIEFLVANAQHMKSVPGRKTDVKDAE